MNRLQHLVATELSRPAPEAARSMADAILAQRGDSVACILFYGSRRREGGTDGLLDLYVLFDRHAAFHRHRVTAAFNRLLPPNVVFMSVPGPDGNIRAKVAVMSRRAFAARMRAASLDTTIWTRFCQPASLLYARDAEAAAWMAATIADGVRTAAGWGKRFAPPGAGSAQRWRTLFARTYRLEIRPEAKGRNNRVYEAACDWFDAASAATEEEATDPTLRRSWLARRLIGKPLNVLRLVKAAFTFEGGADYVAGKLAKHTGVMVSPTRWQQRHPLLGSLGLLLIHRQRRHAMTRQRSNTP